MSVFMVKLTENLTERYNVFYIPVNTLQPECEPFSATPEAGL